jgi:phospholipase/lecithinase/hemolysin
MSLPPVAVPPITASGLAAFPFERLATPLPPGVGYGTMYSFGDSLSDVGNVFSGSANLIPTTVYDGGRFSNGPVWVEDLAKSLALPTPMPSVTGGNDFAFGGAITGSIPGQSAGPLDLPTQLLQFQTQVTAPDPTALYTLSVGGNDVLTLLGQDPATVTTGILDAVSNEVTFISGLVSGGAHNFLVMDAPDLGKTPDVASGGPAEAAAATAISSAFDQTLTTELSSLANTDHLNIGVIDIFTALDQVVANPAAFGFDNVTTPVWSGNVSDPTSGSLSSTDQATQDKSLFFDNLHPTETGHALIAALAQTTLL